MCVAFRAARISYRFISGRSLLHRSVPSRKMTEILLYNVCNSNFAETFRGKLNISPRRSCDFARKYVVLFRFCLLLPKFRIVSVGVQAASNFGLIFRNMNLVRKASTSHVSSPNNETLFASKKLPRLVDMSS